MTDKSEQWLLDGKCHICRKKEYCTKLCRACQNRRQYEVRCAISRAIVRTLTGQ